MTLYEISNELNKLADTDAEGIDVSAELDALQMQFKIKRRTSLG